MSKRLKRIQRKFRDTALQQLDPDGTWSDWLPHPYDQPDSKRNLFHIFDVDRFLSIYNRPVRRRQISHEPGALFPETGVVRSVQDGAVYVIGADRTDVDGSSAIETLTTLHQVSSLCTVKRRVLSDFATSEDPGWLEYVTVGQFYFDSELRTVTEESEQASKYVGKYFTFTNCSDLRPNDVIYFPDGQTFIVEMPYRDAGFWSARVVRLRDTRADILVTNKTAAPATTTTGWNPYNPDSSSPAEPSGQAKVTAWIGMSATEEVAASVSMNEKMVFIDEFAIGFVPTTSDTLDVDGETWQVVEVKYNQMFEQYRLRCERV